MPGEPCSQFGWAVKINAATPARPKEKFYDPLNINKIGRRLRMRLRKNARAKSRHIAISLFESDPDGNAVWDGIGERSKGAVGEHCRSESRIQRRGHRGADQVQAVINVHLSRCVVTKAHGEFKRSGAQIAYDSILHRNLQRGDGDYS